MPDPKPHISLVVPAYNEERYLPRLLASVEAARSNCRGGRNAIEVIVSDNASTDTTAAIAREAGCAIARVGKRRIGAVRNGGAALARGQILAFVDADLEIHPETFNAIGECMDSGQFAGGATGWKFERNSLGLATTRFLVRILVTGLMRMEGGVVFCARETFDAIGGYSDSKDIAEDVEFFRAIRAHGKKLGRRMKLGFPGLDASVSTRKFDEHGDWHMFLMPLWPITKRQTFRKIVDDYWYPEKR